MAARNGIIGFIHTADWHLGLTRNSLRDRNGIPLEFGWIKNSAMELVDYVRANGIELVLMCGDILHSSNPSPTVENILAEIFDKITDSGAKIVYMLGNHEIPGWGDHPARIYDTLNVPNVIIADEIAVHKLNLDGKIVQIATIPSNSMQEMSFEDALKIIRDELAPGLPAILMSHIFIDGAKLSGSDISRLPNESHISPIVINHLPFQYIALGHIHRYQKIFSEPPAIYSGSLQRVTFAEENETKGFVDVKIIPEDENFKTQWHFIPVHSTKFITADIDIRGIKDAEEYMISRISSLSLDGAMVRIRIYRRIDDVKVSLPRIRKLGKELGAISVRIEDKIDRDKNRVDIEEIKPSGDIAADVEKYIKSQTPHLVDKSEKILKTIDELEREIG